MAQIPWDDLVDSVTGILLDDACAAATAKGIEVDRAALVPAVRRYTRKFVKRQLAKPWRQILKQLTLAGIENDVTPKELSDRISDSVLFHPVHALMLARILLGNGKRHND
jgi:hypothetical protein